MDLFSYTDEDGDSLTLHEGRDGEGVFLNIEGGIVYITPNNAHQLIKALQEHVIIENEEE